MEVCCCTWSAADVLCEGQIRVHLYGHPCDMRKSFPGLYALTVQGLREDPLSGDLSSSSRGEQIVFHSASIPLEPWKLECSFLLIISAVTRATCDDFLHAYLQRFTAQCCNRHFPRGGVHKLLRRQYAFADQAMYRSNTDSQTMCRLPVFSALSILSRLKEIYPRWVDPAIVDVQIAQTTERVWLEITKEEEVAGYLKNQTIERSDLGFITEKDHLYFKVDVAVTENARKFTEEFGPFSIINTTDLFHGDACEEVNEKYNPHP